MTAPLDQAATHRLLAAILAGQPGLPGAKCRSRPHLFDERGLIGGRASLNLLAAFVSPSGGGKGISDKVAREAWPAEIIERPIGSGEGIAALFAPPRKEGAERITRAILHEATA